MRATALAIMLSALAGPVAALAGPDFIEGGDAGRVAGTAQPVEGAGPVQSISGELTGSESGPGDFEDMYLIQIVDPQGFFASTDPNDGGFAEFDSQLWLMNYLPASPDPLGFALLANDSAATFNQGPSRILPFADDGTGAFIATPGLYLLAITGFDNDPQSIDGDIYQQLTREEISGPDGPGAFQPHTDWDGEGEFGHYLISLGGVEFIPKGGPLKLLSSDPPTGAIDAGHPSEPDGSDPAGWSSLTMTFNGSVAGLQQTDFGTSEVGGDGIAPPVLTVVVLSFDTVEVVLGGMLEPGTWTNITYLRSGDEVQLGFLPADANGDATSTAVDLLAVIDHLNGVVLRPLYSVDVDRSGTAAAPDVLRVVDLLNGAGVYDSWLGVSLP